MNISKPQIKRMQSHKRRLRAALLTAHENHSWHTSFGHIIKDIIKHMSLGKKSTAIATLAVFGLVVTAGIFGPSASEVAQAEAVSTVRRAFAQFANLSEDEKEEMEQKFQDRVHFREQGEPMFHGMDEMTPEEREAKHAEMKASLADSLAEAQAAEDLEVISAPEMPKPGFMGKAGRAFGFKMMHKCPESIEDLPEEIQQKIQEHEDMRADMQPIKWLKYTNSEGKIVKLGLNANEEPVVKFVEGELPFGDKTMHEKEGWKGIKGLQ